LLPWTCVLQPELVHLYQISSPLPSLRCLLKIFCPSCCGTGVWTQGHRLATQAPYHLSHSASPFLCVYFQDRASWSICLGWTQTLILLISTSQVASIIGISHQCLAVISFFGICLLQSRRF
jgi:hypothetical protein